MATGPPAFAADVTKLASMEAMAKAAAERHGGIDVLCANAGIFPQAKIEDMTPRAVGRGDRHQSQGHLPLGEGLRALSEEEPTRAAIVITSSITGPITGFPGWTHYGATKAGQLGFMRTACIELAKYGITVNAVLPGNIITEGLRASARTIRRPWRPRSR